MIDLSVYISQITLTSAVTNCQRKKKKGLQSKTLKPSKMYLIAALLK